VSRSIKTFIRVTLIARAMVVSFRTRSYAPWNPTSDRAARLEAALSAKEVVGPKWSGTERSFSQRAEGGSRRKRRRRIRRCVRRRVYVVSTSILYLFLSRGR